MESRVLCLIEREPGTFQFEVQSLQEYFAAAYIFDHAPTKGDLNSRDDCLNALLERPYWSNVCRFFVGMFSKVEVRGIRQSLTSLNARTPLNGHPHLRMMAARFLDDRTFQGQADEPIRDIVDFVLDGPGVVFSVDGYLTDAGEPMVLSEDSGQAQAVAHLKRRLATSTPDDERRMVSTALSHYLGGHDIGDWWWQQFSPDPPS